MFVAWVLGYCFCLYGCRVMTSFFSPEISKKLLNEKWEGTPREAYWRGHASNSEEPRKHLPSDIDPGGIAKRDAAIHLFVLEIFYFLSLKSKTWVSYNLGDACRYTCVYLIYLWHLLNFVCVNTNYHSMDLFLLFHWSSGLQITAYK